MYPRLLGVHEVISSVPDTPAIICPSPPVSEIVREVWHDAAILTLA